MTLPPYTRIREGEVHKLGSNRHQPNTKLINIRRGEGGGAGKGGPLWSPASCSLCSSVGQRDHTTTGRPPASHLRWTGDGLPQPCRPAISPRYVPATRCIQYGTSVETYQPAAQQPAGSVHSQ